MSIGHSIFIRIDLSDPYAKQKRPCDRATIGMDLNCVFDEWDYNSTGNQIIPDEILPIPFILAIDGPQGLAGNPENTMRLSERKLGTAGKSPYAFQPIRQPNAGFIKGSIELYYSLVDKGFHLHRLKAEKADTNLIEVYPGSAWPVIAGYRLQKKRLLVGRQSRYELLTRVGIKFSPKYSLEVLQGAVELKSLTRHNLYSLISHCQWDILALTISASRWQSVVKMLDMKV